MLLFYTSSVPARLRYIVHLLLEEMSGLPVTFTSSLQEYLSREGPKVAYCKEDPGSGLFVESSGLLFEQEIYPHEIAIRRYRDLPVLFECSHPGSAFPFDILAASFYLVSRYEEYVAAHHDQHGRFPATSAIAFRGGFLQQPVVNIWLKMFLTRLRRQYPSLMTHQKPYRYLPTIDIDHAYAYLYRSLYRTLGGVGRSLLHARLAEVPERIRVLLRLASDPFDTYATIRALHEDHRLSTLMFVLFADYGGDDNNIGPGGSGFRELIQGLASWSGIGIHPSLSSAQHPARLKREKEGLEQVLGREVTSSRQHFLKFSFPSTFQRLAALGITDEYSMGYASHPGFRAGIAHPFPFFDLSLNEVSPLMIHPVPVMDVTFRDYLRLTPEESLHEIKQIIDQVRLYNGEFISLWHNESLSDTGRWKGWKRLYQEVVTEAAE